MPRADKNYTFYTILLPAGYRRLSRRKRIILELSVGLAILAIIPIGVFVRMPAWLQLIGWAVFIICLLGESVVIVRRWRERRARGL